MTKELTKDQIYIDFQHKVLGYIYHKIGYSHTAEDLCADVFVKVYAHLDCFDETKSSLSTWIYTITRNTVYDYFRTSHPMVEIGEKESDGSNFTEDIYRKETLEELADALERLSEIERDLILFRYYKGLTLKEISKRMGYSYSYIKVIHNKALDKLKKYLKNE